MQSVSRQFTLGESITQEQLNYFEKNGLIHFKSFIGKDIVALFISELNRIGDDLVRNEVDKINGVPLKYGKDDKGKLFVQRFAFTSKYSNILHEFLQDPRFRLLLEFLYPYEGRMGEQEKDGLVVNQYINSPDTHFSQMGWHTDSARDIFLRERIKPMLNVGIHLDDCAYKNGGLRALPGTHKQNLFKLFFRKKYFVDHNPDPGEVGFNIEAGDLTIHDGRLWHRAQKSPFYGAESIRRVMYIPIITGRYKPKHQNSKTPFYHRLAGKIQN